MFCRYKGELPPLKAEVVYWIDFRTTAPTGQLEVVITGMYRHVYLSFEEFLSEWEIV